MNICDKVFSEVLRTDNDSVTLLSFFIEYFSTYDKDRCIEHAISSCHIPIDKFAMFGCICFSSLSCLGEQSLNHLVSFNCGHKDPLHKVQILQKLIQDWTSKKLSSKRHQGWWVPVGDIQPIWRSGGGVFLSEGNKTGRNIAANCS